LSFNIKYYLVKGISEANQSLQWWF
jgi:hypothetical protein